MVNCSTRAGHEVEQTAICSGFPLANKHEAPSDQKSNHTASREQKHIRRCTLSHGRGSCKYLATAVVRQNPLLPPFTTEGWLSVLRPNEEGTCRARAPDAEELAERQMLNRRFVGVPEQGIAHLPRGRPNRQGLKSHAQHMYLSEFDVEPAHAPPPPPKALKLRLSCILHTRMPGTTDDLLPFKISICKGSMISKACALTKPLIFKSSLS